MIYDAFEPVDHYWVEDEDRANEPGIGANPRMRGCFLGILDDIGDSELGGGLKTKRNNKESKRCVMIFFRIWYLRPKVSPSLATLWFAVGSW